MSAPAISRFSLASMLPRLAERVQFIGIDVGVDRVKLIGLGDGGEASRLRGPALEWLHRIEFPLPIDPFEPPPQHLVELVCEQLHDQLPRCVDADRMVAAVSLPMPWVLLETTAESQLDVNLTHCDQTFQGSVFQSACHRSHWPMAAEKELRMVAAVAESGARAVAETISQLGYDLRWMLPHGAALMHAAEALTGIPAGSIVLLEPYGGLVTTPADTGCYSRPLPCATSGVLAHLHVDALESWLEVTANEIDATFRFTARQTGRGIQPSPVLLCGSIAQIDGVSEALASLLEHPVAVWRFAGGEHLDAVRGSHESIASLDPSYAVAFSLAYCASSEWRSGRPQ